MPTEPAELRERLDRRGPRDGWRVRHDTSGRSRSYGASLHTAVETARLLSAVGDGGRPVDRVGRRTNGRSRADRRGRPIQPGMGLTGRSGTMRPAGVERIAARRTRRGRACARCSIITAPATWKHRSEIDALMQRTDPSLVGLCLDSGACACYGGGSPLDVAVAPPREDVARPLQGLRAAYRRARRREQLDYQTALGHGLFCELGGGSVDFPGVAPRPSGCGLRRLDCR